MILVFSLVTCRITPINYPHHPHHLYHPSNNLCMTTDNDADNDVFFMSGQRTEYADRTCSLSVLPVNVAKGVRFARSTQNQNSNPFKFWVATG